MTISFLNHGQATSYWRSLSESLHLFTVLKVASLPWAVPVFSHMSHLPLNFCETIFTIPFLHNLCFGCSGFSRVPCPKQHFLKLHRQKHFHSNWTSLESIISKSCNWTLKFCLNSFIIQFIIQLYPKSPYDPVFNLENQAAHKFLI